MRTEASVLLLVTLVLCGCAADGAARAPGGAALRPAAVAAAPAAANPEELASLGDNRQASSGVYTDLIRSMLAQQQYYAALAHIQEQQRRDGGNDELRFLEAETRRQLGQVVEADKLYRKLLRGEWAAQSYRGLGLLHAAGNLPAATQFLREAVQRQPTSADMRNDLGYALMSAGRYREALPEIATAVELDRDSAKARNNLIILLVLTRDEAGVKKVAEAGNVGTSALAALRRQAQTLSIRIAANRGVQ